MELRPCPHCGGTDLQVDYNGVWERNFVRCYNHSCHMQGPEAFGREAAAQAWNALPRKVERVPDSQLDALEKLAGEETPGPWGVEETPIVAGYYGGINAADGSTIVRATDFVCFECGEFTGECGIERKEDAAFIAAANPAVVLALIHELRCSRSRERNRREKGEVTQ